MDLQVIGRCTKLFESRWTSKKDFSEHLKHHFVIETEEQYPKSICFSVLDGERYSRMGLVVGGRYSVSFNVESREWDGRWYTEAIAWRAVSMDAQPTTSPQPQNPSSVPPPTYADNGGGHSGVPF